MTGINVEKLKYALDCDKPCNSNCETYRKCPYLIVEANQYLCDEPRIKNDALTVINILRQDATESMERIVTYHINDYKCFENQYTKQAGIETATELMKNIIPFCCTLVLKGGRGEKFPSYYGLYDVDGNKMAMNALNGYQKGVIINDCYKHYAGAIDKPFGVVKIIEDGVTTDVIV